tara:strand:- start:14312 stop:15229 length:918 start_codon:yes stop_codon:yes gene_type:complete
MGITIDRYHEYYANDGDHGSYRSISLQEIIDSFHATYVGKGKLCEHVVLNDITFHAIRGLQELSYDTLKSINSWEITVPSTLTMVMPVDFVNYVKLSWTDDSGIERILLPTRKSSNPRNITVQLNDEGAYPGMSEDTDLPSDESSDTLALFKAQTSNDLGDAESDEVDDIYGELLGGRFGIEPENAYINGSFIIDENAGKFHFSSNLAGKHLVLKYVSDGIISTSAATSEIDLTSSMVPKLAEEAIYKHILYGVLLARKDSPAGLLAQIKRERFAETRKAKLRLSNVKLEEITQIIRGSSKHIKH